MHNKSPIKVITSIDIKKEKYPFVSYKNPTKIGIKDYTIYNLKFIKFIY